MPIYPTLDYEHHFWSSEAKCVMGLDEVGRGAVAGPVCVGAVIFPKDFDKTNDYKQLSEVRDSKTISKNKREKLAELIQDLAIAYSTSFISAAEIDKNGIRRAVHKAGLNALKKVSEATEINVVIADKSLFIKNDGFYYKEIVKGDQKSFTIAAASIIAKVTRDAYMYKLSGEEQYKPYNWENNVGYGTKKHLMAIKEFGLSDQHRKTFLRKYI